MKQYDHHKKGKELELKSENKFKITITKLLNWPLA
jgi:hypothetical protein